MAVTNPEEEEKLKKDINSEMANKIYLQGKKFFLFIE